MEVREITQKDIWEGFLLGCEEKTFLHSWNWGEFNKRMGERVWRLGVYANEQGTKNKEQLLAVALVLKIRAKRGTFLLIPHGPTVKSKIKNQKSKILEVLINRLKEIAREEKSFFIRIAPIWERNEENQRIFEQLGFREAPIHVHPELTWILDITPSEEELLMQMRKTTRYLIRQGMKNQDVRVYKSQKLKDVEIFNRLYQETVKRHQFAPFSFEYLRNEFLSFLPNNQTAIFVGKYKDELLSSAMIIFWQGIAFYHQGASSSKYPKIPVSYLLQWEAIKEAKRRGRRFYNFWGIADIKSKIKNQKSKRHPWAGLTLFKIGFGGYKKEYLKTQDLILSKKYWFTYLFEVLRKKKRGF